MRLHRSSLFAAALGSTLFTGPFIGTAEATWSIIVIDTRTKEIGIGSCTCLTLFDLLEGSPVVLVEVGAAAAQSAIDSGGTNRMIIHDQLLGETPPEDIIELLSGVDPNHQSRQYGIVDTLGRAATFTGTRAGGWAGGLTGSVGDLVYSIQGNVLTGEPVVTAAEMALVETQGDLPAKLMAAMEAARAMGGDGRCSCPGPDPEACGAPPPTFNKSSHIGYMVVARPGDTDGICNGGQGCANGDYFFVFNHGPASGGDPDPVFLIQDAFDQFRADHIGRPDAGASTVAFTKAGLDTSGSDTVTMTIALNDWTHTPVTASILGVTIEHGPESDGLTSIGEVSDLGGGVYEVVLSATQRIEGRDEFNITVDDGIRPVQLMPRPSISIETAPGLLHLSAPTPGIAGQVNEICVDGAQPGARAGVVWGLQGGTRVTPCGTFDVNFVGIVATGFADANGDLCVNGDVPLAARNRTVLLQATESPLCATSNLVRIRFE